MLNKHFQIEKQQRLGRTDRQNTAALFGVGVHGAGICEYTYASEDWLAGGAHASESVPCAYTHRPPTNRRIRYRSGTQSTESSSLSCHPTYRCLRYTPHGSARTW